MRTWTAHNGKKFHVMPIYGGCSFFGVTVSHNEAYQHLQVNEEEACRQFGESGMSCAAVRAQATAVEAEEAAPMKLSGLADTGVDGRESLRVEEVEVVEEEVHPGVEGRRKIVLVASFLLFWSLRLPCLKLSRTLFCD